MLHKKSIIARSVSALALTVGLAGGAAAQTTLTNGSAPITLDTALAGGTTSITVAGGGSASAVLNALGNYSSLLTGYSWINQAAGTGSGIAILSSTSNGYWNGQWSGKSVPVIEFVNGANGAYSPYTTAKIPMLNVASGVTLYVAGTEGSGSGYSPWLGFNGSLNDQGNLVVGASGGNVSLLSSPTTLSSSGNVNSLILAGNNTVAGNLLVMDNATVQVGQAYKGSYYGTGELTFGASSSVILGHNALLAINSPGFTTTINGPLVSTDKTGELFMYAGSLTLNGQNTASQSFTGILTMMPSATSVLTVGDASHANAVFGDPSQTNGAGTTLNLTSNSGGVVALNGYGTIYGTVNNSSGVVTPGGTAGKLGTLTVAQYSQGAAGTLNVEVSPAGASQLKVLGAASLNGALKVTLDSGSYGNAVYPILSAGQVSGAFSSVVTAGSSGSALIGLAETATGYDLVTESSAGAQVFGHLDSVNRDTINAFTRSLFDESAPSSPIADSRKANFANGFSLWVEPEGRMSNVSHDGYSYSTDSAGVTGGIEHRWDNSATAGLAASYAASWLNTQGHQTTANIQTYTVAAYGGIELPNARLDGNVFWNSYSASVTRSFGDGSGSAQSSPSGQAYGGSLQLSKGLYNDFVVPYLRGTYAYNRNSAVTESGGLLALSINNLDQESFVGDFGVRVHPVLPIEDVTLRPEIDLAIEHDFTKPGEQVSGNFIGTPFTWNWKGDQSTAVVAGVQLASEISDAVELFGRLDGRFTSFGSEGGIMVGARYRF